MRLIRKAKSGKKVMVRFAHFAIENVVGIVECERNVEMSWWLNFLTSKQKTYTYIIACVNY